MKNPKFRVYDKRTNERIGACCLSCDGMFSEGISMYDNPPGYDPWMPDDEFKEHIEIVFPIGMKDRDEKDIFDGDMVMIESLRGVSKYEVIWSDADCGYLFESKEGFLPDIYPYETAQAYIQIVGDRYNSQDPYSVPEK